MSDKTQRMKEIFAAQGELRAAKKSGDRSRIAQAEANYKMVSKPMTDAQRQAAGLPSRAEAQAQRFNKKVARVIEQGSEAMRAANQLVKSGESKHFLATHTKEMGLNPPKRRGNPNIGKMAKSRSRDSQGIDFGGGEQARFDEFMNTKPATPKRRGNPNIANEGRKYRESQKAGTSTPKKRGNPMLGIQQKARRGDADAMKALFENEYRKLAGGKKSGKSKRKSK